jgi:hypothetical protein
MSPLQLNFAFSNQEGPKLNVTHQLLIHAIDVNLLAENITDHIETPQKFSYKLVRRLV